MKKMFLTLFTCLPLFSVSQTIQLEKDYMNKLLTDNVQTGPAVAELNNRFMAFIAQNPYPELPYNKQLNSFEFKQVFEIEVSKDVAFNRTLEWVAINFGNISEVLHYSNKDDGKIVVKGLLKLAHKMEYKNFWGTIKESAEITDGKFTMVVTIKNDRIKIEYLNFKYSISYYDAVLHSWINSNRYTSAEVLFPIVAFPENEWKRNLSLLEATDFDVKSTTKSIINYVNNVNQDYSF